MQSCKLFGTSRLAGGFLFIQEKPTVSSGLNSNGGEEGIRIMAIIY